ncbi:protein DA1 [Nocardioides sp. WL0053]|uniref:Protein DA1 n=1 Tax=Nocardioides jiangsuensis TaxID=2866161 RepID=A0ABS7RLP4_9ACTN|nr:protein DA1 [Nocardioides jiangsuensis]MBY9075965.1 protein DA1 [Nocardioides jiangsuensis]
MASLGLTIRHPVKLILKPPAQLTSAGLFTTGPDQLGVTQWTHDGYGRLTGAITIGIAAGLPRPHFRRVLAHEFGHALLAQAGPAKVSPVVAEGFSEALALEHLRGSGAGAVERQIAAQMIASEDPLYGGGLRLVAFAVDRYGLKAVLHALETGRAAAVGLR